jgi:hypothetical protein
LKDVQISRVEEAALEEVFKLIAGFDKKGDVCKNFDAKRIAEVLQKMGMHLTRSEIDLMLW